MISRAVASLCFLALLPLATAQSDTCGIHGTCSEESEVAASGQELQVRQQVRHLLQPYEWNQHEIKLVIAIAEAAKVGGAGCVIAGILVGFSAAVVAGPFGALAPAALGCATWGAIVTVFKGANDVTEKWSQEMQAAYRLRKASKLSMQYFKQVDAFDLVGASEDKVRKLISHKYREASMRYDRVGRKLRQAGREPTEKDLKGATEKYDNALFAKVFLLEVIPQYGDIGEYADDQVVESFYRRFGGLGLQRMCKDYGV